MDHALMSLPTCLLQVFLEEDENFKPYSCSRYACFTSMLDAYFIELQSWGHRGLCVPLKKGIRDFLSQEVHSYQYVSYPYIDQYQSFSIMDSLVCLHKHQYETFFDFENHNFVHNMGQDIDTNFMV